MRCLLDTHTLVWIADPSPRLSRAVHDLLATGKHDVFVSAVTGFELATKYRLGKMPEAAELLQAFDERIEGAGMHALPVSSKHARLAGALSAPHRDPFDRLLAAQAISEQLILLSNDVALDQFGVERYW